MPVKIEVQGVRAIVSRFLDATGLTRAVDAGMKVSVAQQVKDHLAGPGNYPPSPTSSNYTRTYRLGDSWTTKQSGMMSYVIENLTSYAMFVVGDAGGLGQAWMHVNRWWKAADRIRAFMPVVGNLIRQHITDFLNG